MDKKRGRPLKQEVSEKTKAKRKQRSAKKKGQVLKKGRPTMSQSVSQSVIVKIGDTSRKRRSSSRRPPAPAAFTPPTIIQGPPQIDYTPLFQSMRSLQNPMPMIQESTPLSMSTQQLIPMSTQTEEPAEVMAGRAAIKRQQFIPISSFERRTSNLSEDSIEPMLPSVSDSVRFIESFQVPVPPVPPAFGLPRQSSFNIPLRSFSEPVRSSEPGLPEPLEPRIEPISIKESIKKVKAKKEATSIASELVGEMVSNAADIAFQRQQEAKREQSKRELTLEQIARAKKDRQFELQREREEDERRARFDERMKKEERQRDFEERQDELRLEEQEAEEEETEQMSREDVDVKLDKNEKAIRQINIAMNKAEHLGKRASLNAQESQELQKLILDLTKAYDQLSSMRILPRSLKPIKARLEELKQSPNSVEVTNFGFVSEPVREADAYFTERLVDKDGTYPRIVYAESRPTQQKSKKPKEAVPVIPEAPEVVVPAKGRAIETILTDEQFNSKKNRLYREGRYKDLISFIKEQAPTRKVELMDKQISVIESKKGNMRNMKALLEMGLIDEARYLNYQIEFGVGSPFVQK